MGGLPWIGLEDMIVLFLLIQSGQEKLKKLFLVQTELLVANANTGY